MGTREESDKRGVLENPTHFAQGRPSPFVWAGDLKIGHDWLTTDPLVCSPMKQVCSHYQHCVLIPAESVRDRLRKC